MEGSSAAGQRRVGDLLDTDDDVHGSSLLPVGRSGPQPARRSSVAADGPRLRCPGAHPARGQRLRLVGDGAQHRRRAPASSARATTSRSSRPTAAATPRASPRTRPGAASTSSSASAATARSTRWPPASAGTDAAIGVLPGGSTNVFARTHRACPTTRSRRRRCWPPASPPATSSPIGLGHVNGRYFCFHTGVGYDAAVVRKVESTGPRSSAGSGTRCSSTPRVRTWAAGYDRSHPHFTVSSDGARRRARTGYFTIVLNTNPYTYLGNRPLDLSPAATLDRGLVAITFRTMKRRGRSSARSAARCAAAG